MKKISIITVLLLNAVLAFSQITYQYDNLNRLTKVNYSNGTSVVYTYDELGNRQTKTVTAGTDIEEIVTSPIAVFPNPVENELFIRAEQPIDNIEICDITGRIVIANGELSISENERTINVAHLPKGVYLVKIQMGNLCEVRKIVKY
jgi:YD repeat-containing protein